MRLVLPTARSPTTLILSLRRRIRKDSASPLAGSKALRDDYQPVNSAKRTLGRDRTAGNPSSARGRIGFRTMESGGSAKITLDQASFKALASDVRVGILKRLDVRRETVTDLSNLLSLSKPTLLEHLEKLQSAGLVKRVDEGRKWIYYELSDKGRKILHPERVAITLALGIAVALVAIGAFLVLSAEAAFVPGSPVQNPSAPSAAQTVLLGRHLSERPGRPRPVPGRRVPCHLRECRRRDAGRCRPSPPGAAEGTGEAFLLVAGHLIGDWPHPGLCSSPRLAPDDPGVPHRPDSADDRGRRRRECDRLARRRRSAARSVPRTHGPRDDCHPGRVAPPRRGRRRDRRRAVGR